MNEEVLKHLDCIIEKDGKKILYKNMGEKLGKGGFGIVYKFEEQNSNKYKFEGKIIDKSILMKKNRISPTRNRITKIF